MTGSAPLLPFEPEDLDGHTLDELNDYLERGRRPADPSIEGSPACRMALDSLQRLRDLAGVFLTDSPGRALDSGADWIDGVLAAIPVDARPGRRFPWPAPGDAVAARTTEGALRGLVREVGDGIRGVVVGAVRFGEDEPSVVAVEIAVTYGTRVVDAADALRAALLAELLAHAPFAVTRVDVRVVDVVEPAGGVR